MEIRTYFVSVLAGPKVAGKVVAKGDEIALTEHQARAELLKGAIVADKALIEDPFKTPENVPESQDTIASGAGAAEPAVEPQAPVAPAPVVQPVAEAPSDAAPGAKRAARGAAAS